MGLVRPVVVAGATQGGAKMVEQAQDRVGGWDQMPGDRVDAVPVDSVAGGAPVRRVRIHRAGGVAPEERGGR